MSISESRERAPRPPARGGAAPHAYIILRRAENSNDTPLDTNGRRATAHTDRRDCDRMLRSARRYRSDTYRDRRDRAAPTDRPRVGAPLDAIRAADADGSAQSAAWVGSGPRTAPPPRLDGCALDGVLKLPCPAHHTHPAHASILRARSLASARALSRTGSRIALAPAPPLVGQREHRFSLSIVLLLLHGRTELVLA